MDPRIADVVNRLRGSRSLPWLRVIDDAGLDRPADGEPTPDGVVAPYLWLLKRVGDGLRLTQAGYLPMAVVAEALRALGADDLQLGPRLREEYTPVISLRETAQRMGLLRKNRGQLLVTKLGRRQVDDPASLWWHLASRLPDGRSEPEWQAGALYLLTVAAGHPREPALLAQGMSILGWVGADSWSPLSPDDAFNAAMDTRLMFYRLGLLPLESYRGEPELPPLESGVRLARAALLGPADQSSVPAPLPVPEKATAQQAARLTLTLSNIEPAIWRRLVVPESLTLRELHEVIQTAMGWQGYHLHLFDLGGVLYGDVEDIEGRPLGDEQSFTVGQAADQVTEFRYEYDFGDGWDHDIRVEQRITTSGPVAPQVLDGARACPPEDCGGPWGYEHLLEVLADPSHEEHNTMSQWAGVEFDSEAFDVAQTNANLELIDRQSRQR